jgi:hypothetical protein
MPSNKGSFDQSSTSKKEEDRKRESALISAQSLLSVQSDKIQSGKILEEEKN